MIMSVIVSRDRKPSGEGFVLFPNADLSLDPATSLIETTSNLTSFGFTAFLPAPFPCAALVSCAAAGTRHIAVPIIRHKDADKRHKKVLLSFHTIYLLDLLNMNPPKIIWLSCSSF
jgi:hypothetical protein